MDINPHDSPRRRLLLLLLQRWSSSRDSPSEGRTSIHFTHDPGVLTPPHLPPQTNAAFTTAISLDFFCDSPRQHGPIDTFIRRRLSTSARAGFRLRNSHLEAPVLTPHWMERRSRSRERRSGEFTAAVGGALGCVATSPMGACSSPVAWQMKRKNRALCMSRTQPRARSQVIFRGQWRVTQREEWGSEKFVQPWWWY